MSQLEEFGQRWLAAWSGRDRDAFSALCAPDVHYEDPLTMRPLLGGEALGAHAAKLWEAFPDAVMQRSGACLGDGRFIALPMKVMGTNVGALGSLPASGNFVAVHAVFYCELDGSRKLLWRVRAFYDAYAIGVALGLLPRQGSLRQRGLLMMQGFGLRLGR